jgi:hypothetical protein
MSDTKARVEYGSARSEEIAVLRAANARLRRLLVEYGRHNEGCSAQWGDRYRWRCGWREEGAEFRPSDPQPDA